YNPPLLDILPLYVLFMLLSPFVMAHGMRRGWAGWMAASVLLWLTAQFGLSHALYDALRALTGLKVPLSQIGAFDPLAWQFMWMFGLALGAGGMAVPKGPNGVPRFPHWLLAMAVAIGVAGLVWRHTSGQTPFLVWPQFNPLFDKWHLGPLRLVNFFALVVLVLRFGPALLTLKPRWPWLEILGAASLAVFCAHLVVVLLALALFGAGGPQRPVWIDLALLAVAFAVIYGVAWISRLVDRSRAAGRRANPPPAAKAVNEAGPR
ncbi:MAG: OpgC domain-containing protein, partial [Burkholderiales bacterium]